MKYRPLFKLGVSLFFIFNLGCGEETRVEKIENATNEAVDSVNSGLRSADDEICKMVNGKRECEKKKEVNESKNLSDKLDTKIKDIKNKID